MTKCRVCSSECPKAEGNRSSKHYCSSKCYLMNRVEKTESCWFSKTAIRKDGYSSLKVENKEFLAHRLSYLLFRGEIPDDKIVCHTCDKRNCINPEHLYLGDDQTNAIDRQKRNKSCSQVGAKNHRSKLTDQHVKDIRKMLAKGYSRLSLSKYFGVCKSQINNIHNNKQWLHLVA